MFSHIRTMPRADDHAREDSGEGAYVQADLPVFTTSSYQPNVQTLAAMSKNSAPTSSAVRPGQSFADTAKAVGLPTKNEAVNLKSDSNQAPISLGGPAKQKFTRPKGAKAWKPFDDWKSSVHHDHPGSEGHEVYGEWDARPLPYEGLSSSPSRALSSTPSGWREPAPSVTSSITASHPRNDENVPLTARQETYGVFPSTRAETFATESTEAAPLLPRDEIAEVFGEKLPDPIFLNQILGSTHGEIKFIQHPNRDVSAHQWDALQIQWINIGGYSHRLKKIVGQLASDRLRGQTISNSLPPNSLLYFRAVAKQREKIAFESTSAEAHLRQTVSRNDASTAGHPDRPESCRTTVPNDPTPLERPKLHIDIGVHGKDQFGSLSSASSQPLSTRHAGLPTLRSFGIARAGEIAQSDSQDNVKERESEETSAPRSPVSILTDPFVTSTSFPVSILSHAEASQHSNFGRMDMKYKFPIDSSESSELYDPVQRESIEERRRNFEEQERTRIQQNLWSQQRHHAPSNNDLSATDNDETEPVFSYRKALDSMPKDSKAVLDTTSGYYRQEANDQSYYGIDEYVVQQYRAQPQHHQPPRQPPPGDYRSLETPLPVDVGSAQNLRVSEPDPVQYQSHDIISGLDQEPPTPQVWRGGFFENAIPTAHQPTAHLSLRKGYFEELDDWWTSGQLYDRQHSFYQSVLRPMHPIARGVYNHGASRVLIPVYENLSAYIHQKKGTDYFARFVGCQHRFFHD